MGTIPDNRTIWNQAAKSGLYLGLFTAALLFMSMLTGRMSTGGLGVRLLGTLLSIGLWIMRFIGCLWILRFFMLRFFLEYNTSTSRETFRFGMFTALTSSIIVAGYTLLNLTVISPDATREAIDSYMEVMNSLNTLDDSSRLMLERVSGRLPQISFFVNLIYCFLYGTIASRIFSRTIPPRDIFGNPLDSGHDTEASDNKDHNQE